MRKRIISLTVLSMLLAVFVYTAYGNNNYQKKSKKKYVLNFTLKDLDGKTVDFNKFKGKVIILDVWDTWCPPCKAEIPDFIKLYSRYKDKGFLMIGAAIGREGVKNVKDFIKKYEINYPIVLFDRKIMKIFGSFRGIPTTYVIDKNGELYKKYTGFREKSVFENDIKKLLSQ